LKCFRFDDKDCRIKSSLDLLATTQLHELRVFIDSKPSDEVLAKRLYGNARSEPISAEIQHDKSAFTTPSGIPSFQTEAYNLGSAHEVAQAQPSCL
jgi:hypothetical protein